MTTTDPQADPRLAVDVLGMPGDEEVLTRAADALLGDERLDDVLDLIAHIEVWVKLLQAARDDMATKAVDAMQSVGDDARATVAGTDVEIDQPGAKSMWTNPTRTFLEIARRALRTDTGEALIADPVLNAEVLAALEVRMLPALSASPSGGFKIGGLRGLGIDTRKHRTFGAEPDPRLKVRKPARWLRVTDPE